MGEEESSSKYQVLRLGAIDPRPIIFLTISPHQISDWGASFNFTLTVVPFPGSDSMLIVPL